MLGLHHVTCAEYCGKGHSDMQAKLTVDTPEDFQKFDGDRRHRMGRLQDQPADWGKLQWERKGCSTCHSIDGTASQRRPSWKGIWGKMEKLNNGQTVLVDDGLCPASR